MIIYNFADNFTMRGPDGRFHSTCVVLATEITLQTREWRQLEVSSVWVEGYMLQLATPVNITVSADSIKAMQDFDP